MISPVVDEFKTIEHRLRVAAGERRYHVLAALATPTLRASRRIRLQTWLGEGSALVSGGEGQRVRLGRGLLRRGVRLVILDEPFRGFDRERRRELLARARQWWRTATLLCITHDVGETRGFARVLVVEAGQIVEDGVPADLAARPSSRYRALLEAEREVREGLWSSGVWRRLRLEGGRLVEAGRHGGVAWLI